MSSLPSISFVVKVYSLTLDMSDSMECRGLQETSNDITFGRSSYLQCLSKVVFKKHQLPQAHNVFPRYFLLKSEESVLLTYGCFHHNSKLVVILNASMPTTTGPCRKWDIISHVKKMS